MIQPLNVDRWFTTQRLRNALHMKVEIPLLVRLLRVPPRRDVLETGCGAGLGLVALSETCSPASLTGVDLDADLLRQARDRFSARRLTANLVQGDVRELPFPDESFDLVIDFGTLYHVQPARQGITEIARVLRIGAVLVHETPLSQLLAHPVAASRRALPWQLAPQLSLWRSAGLWASRVKHDAPGGGSSV